MNDGIQITLQSDRVDDIKYVLGQYNNVFKKDISIEVKKQLENSEIVLIKNFENFDEIFVVGFYYGTKIQKNGAELEPFVTISENAIGKKRFRIISNDDKLILDVINDYNRRFFKSFTVTRFDYDEVIFAEIYGEIIMVEDIFFLGSSFGTSAQAKRESRLIDW